MAHIAVEALHKRFDDFVAVKNSTFAIEDGEFFVMLGPSGCGKTTTLRMIAGLEKPTSGAILIDREDVTPLRASQRDIAFMFQLFALYPHMNVRNNIAFPLKCQGVGRAERRRRVEETASLLRIDHLIDEPISGLAGGDRQRVALGRAIVREPKAFMMDEPLGALDTEFRELMCDELRALHERMRATTLYVTHDQLEAMSLADRIMVMNHGVIEQMGTPQEIYDKPKTMFVADFIGSPPMNFLTFSGAVQRGSTSVVLHEVNVPVPEFRESQAQTSLALGFRPEHVRLSDAARLRGSVFGTEYLGTNQIVTIDTLSGQIKARVPSHLRVVVGEQVGIECDAARAVVFDAESGRAIDSVLYGDMHHG